MAQRRLRVALDANILIAGLRQPRAPFEVMRAAITRYFDLILPEQVITEARRHLDWPAGLAALEFFLTGSAGEVAPMPPREMVRRNLDLVRSERDVPIALALLAAETDIFVTGDRDFTDPGATAPRFHERVRVMTPAPFLVEVLGWSPEGLDVVRSRTWDDLAEG